MVLAQRIHPLVCFLCQFLKLPVTFIRVALSKQVKTCSLFILRLAGPVTVWVGQGVLAGQNTCPVL